MKVFHGTDAKWHKSNWHTQIHKSERTTSMGSGHTQKWKDHINGQWAYTKVKGLHQRAEGIHKVKGSHQWAEGIHKVKGPHQWGEGIHKVKGPHQWAEGIHKVKGPHQWAEGIHKVKGPHQWAEGIHKGLSTKSMGRGHTQRLKDQINGQRAYTK